MSVNHGIRTTILPTPTVPVRQVSAGLTACIGAVPAWQLDGSGADAKGLLGPFATLAEFKAACGWSDDFAAYPGCEAAEVFFTLYNVGPLLIINPLDPVADGTQVNGQAVALVGGVHTIEGDGLLLSTLVVTSADGNTTYDIEDDYTAAYDEDFNIVITRVADGAIASATAQIKPSYKTVDTTPASGDIVDMVAVVDEIYPKKRVLVGQLIAPGWSDTPAVAAAMTAKMATYNALFGAIALTDVPSDTVTAYANVAAWLATNSYTSAVQVNCWPLVTLGEATYHLSTHIAALNCLTDSQHSDIPYTSPSNKALQIDGAVLDDGTPVVLGPETYTASEVPFVTAINFLTWTAWGNRTGAYATSTDPLTFISNQRMVQWVRNTLVLTFWPAVDRPINARLVDTLCDTANQWFNSLTQRRALLGGRCEFQNGLNTPMTLSDGQLVISYYLGLESPARLIEQVIQMDTAYYAAL
jgi:hypothetical protein